MEESYDHLVYSKNVIEFVTVGREYCHFLEQTNEYSKPEFIRLSLRMMPLLYLKTVVLPKVEPELEDMVEKFVDEDLYNHIKASVETKLGVHNDYLEVFTPDINRADTAVAANIAEDLADIYQDIKDFLEVYKTGVTELMNDALAEMVNNFEIFWGQKAVNCLRALHNVNYSGDNLTDDTEEDETSSDKRNTSNWIFSQRQQQWNLDNDIPLD
jgi:hypothetical protein